LYVTHDQEEAFSLADQVVVINAGHVEQIGVPQMIYRQPASLFVARFLGLNNLLPGLVIQKDGKSIVETSIGILPAQTHISGEATVLIRPDGMRLDGSGDYVFEGTVVEGSFRGTIYRAAILVNGVTLTFEFLSSVRLPPAGGLIRLSFDPAETIQIFPKLD
jgi:ABC-type Fe3+/spermidine/putrescine transport system ATPase subunit